MSNKSSGLSGNRRVILLWVAGAALLALSAPGLRAQCSADDDPDSFGCQLQQAAPPPSVTPAGGGQTIMTMQQAAAQALRRGDASNDASAENGLTSGSSYTEQAIRKGQNGTTQLGRQPLPPEPPTEFQRFVATTTGKTLPIFGARLFAGDPAAFGPVDHAPAPQDMVVGAGDELRIRLWGQINFSANLQVSREGEIYLPRAGAVHVAGMPFSAVAGHLRTALERVYRNFQLSVDMGEIHTIQVYVAGQARQPGEYAVSGLSTLVDALFLSGGPARSGSMRHVELKREGKVVTDFDLYSLLVKGDKTGDVQLQQGDVLFIPAKGPEVALMGSVRLAAIYELRGQESLEEALEAAGGRTAVASGGRISIERIEDHAQRGAFEVASDAAGLAAKLADGDIVRIDPIASNYRDTVTLRGSIANPGRFRWHAGMRLSELMPDRDSLVSRDYWWQRTQLGLPAPEFTPMSDLGAMGRMRGGASSNLPIDRMPGTQTGLSAGTQANLPLSSQSQSQQQPQSQQQGQTGQYSRNAFGGQMQPMFSDDDPTGALRRAQQTGPSGSAGSLGGIEVGSRMGQETALLRPEAATDWNYAVIDRLDPATMTTSLVPFDLGKLVLNHDAAQDLELQPGDIVTVFSQDDIQQPRDQQTKYVRLEGEFVHAGVYSVLPGDTLRTLVARAGGLTANAYLYASEFTRKSTQAIEQQRLNEYADRLEHQLARNSISIASMAGAGASGGAGSQGEIAAIDRQLIAQLRQLQPTGRIVLNLAPHSAGANELPDAPLEDGDRLLVPSTPATIQVVGAVLDQNAFLYRAEGRVGDYLHLAGGFDRDADRRQMFVLRADGSVVARSQNESVFAAGIERARLYPGDSIIVPEKRVTPGVMHEFLNWTQIFSQLALGAAAINIIK